MILTYDKSLSGFLCLLGSAVKERIAVDAIHDQQQTTTVDLFVQERVIATDPDWAATVARGLQKKLGKTFLTRLAQAFYSEEDGIEQDLVRLTRFALHEGRACLANAAHPLVNRIDSAALKTARERHCLLGLLRFRHLTDESFLACCSPRTNVVPLLGGHFCQRLGDQRWLILDERRKVAVFGEKRCWQVAEQVTLPRKLSAHSGEQQIADLWRCFYDSVSNPDRFNPKLRQQFMPKRIWSYLTEMQPSARGFDKF